MLIKHTQVNAGGKEETKELRMMKLENKEHPRF